jgi:hypothetical protein
VLRIVRFALFCLCLLATALAPSPHATAQLASLYGEHVPAHAPRQRPLPWPRRQRTGVVVVDDLAARDPLLLASRRRFAAPEALLPPGVLSALDLRRLGLRPRRSTVLAAWPSEPAAPPVLYAERFAQALTWLCPAARSPGEVAELARRVLRAAAEYGVDPLLLAALAYHQSGCDPELRSSYGVGLTQINVGMHQRFVRAGRYAYHTLDPGHGWRPRSLLLPSAAFTAEVLREPVANLRHAAAMLHVFERQCPAIDAAFGSAPHRHFVSHFVWGDRIRHTTPEDQILVARRRLLAYYGQAASAARAEYRGLGLRSALDGPPRLVIGVMGDPRDGGARAHAGIDFASAFGEPVRAVAAGHVRIAGVDRPDGELVGMKATSALRIAPGRTGPRGLFVMLDHGRGLTSLYAHLATYVVESGQRVQAGELLGYVGRSGMRASDAHLHFGLFADGAAIDPLPVLAPYAVAPARGTAPHSAAATE